MVVGVLLRPFLRSCICGVGLLVKDDLWLRIALFLYLAVALKNAYEIKSWLLSLLYAVVVNVIYIVTTLVAIAVVVFIAIIVLVM